jgi:endonuclease YncB( thermonuclease family)
MKKLLLTILLSVSLTTPALAQKKQPVGVTHDAEITRVVDGDTVGFKATFLPAPLKPELLIRIYGVDTPEKGFRAGCPAEKAQGEAASAFTKNVIATAKKHQIVLYRWDKFGGRVLGDVILDGKSLRALLMQNGFAREYYGDAKQSWCD